MRTSSMQTVNGAGVRRASCPPMWNAISMPGSSGASIVNVPEYVCGVGSAPNSSFQNSRYGGPACPSFR